MPFFLEREIARKDERRIEMSVGLARFPFVRDLTGFDFSAQPSIDKAQVKELMACRFIANAEALLLLGPPGVGKTHRSGSPLLLPPDYDGLSTMAERFAAHGPMDHARRAGVWPIDGERQHMASHLPLPEYP